MPSPSPSLPSPSLPPTASFDPIVPVQLHHEDLDDIEAIDAGIGVGELNVNADFGTDGTTGIDAGLDNGLEPSIQSHHQRLNRRHTVVHTRLSLQGTIIILYLCLITLIYIITCMIVKDALTLESLCFQGSIICFSGFDGYVHIKRQILVDEVLANMSVQLTVLIIVMIYGNTDNESIVISATLLAIKLFIMSGYCLCVIVNINDGYGNHEVGYHVNGHNNRNGGSRGGRSSSTSLARDSTIHPAPWTDPIDLLENEHVEWTCAICLESDPRRVVKLNNCTHMLHPHCAKTLVESNHTLCPMCKKPLF